MSFGGSSGGGSQQQVTPYAPAQAALGQILMLQRRTANNHLHQLKLKLGL